MPKQQSLISVKFGEPQATLNSKIQNNNHNKFIIWQKNQNTHLFGFLFLSKKFLHQVTLVLDSAFKKIRLAFILL